MEIEQSIAKSSKRIAAYVIDIIPITLLVLFIFYQFFGFDETLTAYLNRGKAIEPRIQFLKERNLIRDFSFLIWVVYCIFMESSIKQGTIGKSIVGIIVVNENGNRMTIRESIKRNACKLLSYLGIFLGFIWILFDKKKQGWHDKITKTFVVNKK